MDLKDVPNVFWAKVRKTDGCWLWAGRTQVQHKKTRRGVGYGLFTGTFAAHRLSFELHNGPIPDGLCVMHTCDNPACVNPKHLVLGTYADNNRDKTVKGRNANGERHGMSKLTLAKVEEIRAILSQPSRPSYSQIAHQFGVTKGAITWIATGGTWRTP